MNRDFLTFQNYVIASTVPRQDTRRGASYLVQYTPLLPLFSNQKHEIYSKLPNSDTIPPTDLRHRGFARGTIYILSTCKIKLLKMALPAQTLQGKVAIVTGAARGIGASIALDLAKRGAKVCITYTSESSESKTTDLISQVKDLPNGTEMIAVRADAADENSPSRIVDATIKAFGNHIDILVNNAAVEIHPDLSKLTKKDFDFVFHINVLHPLLLSQAILPHLRKPGRVINVSSVGARIGIPQMSLYASSKSAIEGLTRSLAAELGDKVEGTTVNAIAPGPIVSDMLDGIPENVKNAQRDATPVAKRFGQPDEVANVVSWLASPEASWISGQVLNVSGGWTMY